MDFTAKEHTGIDEETFSRPFFLKHFAAYRFSGNIVKDKNVLEIGFGTGYGSRYLADFAAGITAIDLFENNVKIAGEKHVLKNLSFRTMDACRLNFKDNTFDVVCAFQLIEHVPQKDHNKFLDEVKRVLKKTGAFILSTPNLINLMKDPQTYKKNPHHDKEFTPDEFRSVLKDHFNRIEEHSVDFSLRYKFFLCLKKSGIFKFFPGSMDIPGKYFETMPENDLVVLKGFRKKSPDLLAVVSM